MIPPHRKATLSVTGISFLCLVLPLFGETDELQEQPVPDSSATSTGAQPKKVELSPNKDEAIIELGRRDLKSALAVIESTYSEDQRRPAASRLIYALCKERLDLIAQLPQYIPAELVPPGIPGIGFLAEIVPPGIPRIDLNSALQGICISWVNKDAGAIIRYADEIPDGPLKNQLRDNLAVCLTAADRFLDAERLLEKRLPAEIPRSVLSDLVTSFKGKDDGELFLWASKLPGEGPRDVFGSLSFKYEFKKDITELQKLLMYAPEASKGVVLERLGRTIGKVEGDKALKWIQSLGIDPRERNYALTGALRTAPAGQVQSLFEAVVLSIEAPARNEAVYAYVDRMFLLNRQKAIDWATTSPLDIRSIAIRRLVWSWYREDAGAVWNWANTLDHGTNRDLAIKTYVETLGKTDPARARAQSQ